MPLRYPQSFTPALGVTLACLATAPACAEDYAFKVFCNGNPVGYQHVQVRHDDGQTQVDTDVAVNVHMAGFEIYRYRYRASETWRDGRLSALTSETDDDGEALSLSVHPADDGMLLVENKEGSRKIPADTLPTSYWNPAVLDRGELLDTESGKLLKVAVSSSGDGHYAVSGDLNAEVDYRFGHWSGAHFHYFGADIDFRPETHSIAGTQ
jgi:hypothetical protein